MDQTSPSSDIQTQPRRLAIAAFDVDGTLTWTDSFMLFLRFVRGRWGFVRRLLQMLPVFVAYGLGLKSRDETKNRLMTAFLGGISAARFEQHCVAFASVAYPIITRPDAMARVNNHLGVNDHVVLVSASLENYLVHFARDIGADAVLATQVDVNNGVLSGAMAGPNCRSEQKVARLRQYDGQAHLVAAYGDSAGDKDMLAAAQTGGYRIFQEAPKNWRALLWDMYAGDLLERRAAALSH